MKINGDHILIFIGAVIFSIILISFASCHTSKRAIYNREYAALNRWLDSLGPGLTDSMIKANPGKYKTANIYYQDGTPVYKYGSVNEKMEERCICWSVVYTSDPPQYGTMKNPDCKKHK